MVPTMSSDFHLPRNPDALLRICRSIWNLANGEHSMIESMYAIAKPHWFSNDETVLPKDAFDDQAIL